MSPDLIVKEIEAPSTWPLRSKVLRPGYPPEAAQFAGDNDPDSRHFGAFLNGELVGVASLFLKPLPDESRLGEEEQGREEWQLRGMAVAPNMQKSGCGRVLVNGFTGFVDGRIGALLWCNARGSAVDFYRKNGFETRGEEFEIPSVGPHYVMVYRKPS